MCAIDSVLHQTETAFELLVVLDGPDPATAARFEALGDERLTVLTRHPGGNGNAARNLGVRTAAAPLIALLDDDDEWRPDHLEKMLGASTAQRGDHWALFARFVAATQYGSETWPTTLKVPDEQVGDYLFDRRQLLHGEAMLHPSTMVCPRSLLLAHPFDETLTRHQDWDWLIRTEHAAGLVTSVMPDVGATVRVQDGRVRPAFPRSEQLAWIEGVRPLISRRAYSGYLLTQVGVRAAATKDVRLGWFALRSAVWRGRPRLRHLTVFVGLWVVPAPTRRRLRARLRRAGATA